MKFGLKGTSWVCHGRHGEVGIVEYGIKAMHQQLFAELLVEGVWEKIGEARQNLNTIQRQVREITEQQKQRTYGSVHHRHLYLETGDELDQTNDSKDISATT